MTLRVNYEGRWMLAPGMSGMTIAQIRSVCQAKLSVSNQAIAFLNNRRISSEIESRAVVRNFDELEFLTQQEVFIPPNYKRVDLPPHSVKAESTLEPAATWL